MVYMNSQ